MTLIEALLPEWDREMGLTRQVLTRVPEGRFQWQPHPTSMSLGRLAAHLVDIPRWAVSSIDQNWFEPPPDAETAPEVETPGAMLARFDANARAGRAILVGKTDAELLAPWTRLSGGHEVFTMPKATALRNFVLNHTVHHRGQLTVYLRMLGVPMPSVYGPSADASLESHPPSPQASVGKPSHPRTLAPRTSHLPGPLH